MSRGRFYYVRKAEGARVFQIEIAGLTVQIDNKYDEVYEHCIGYILPENREPDICVEATEEYIAAGREWLLKYDNTVASDSYAEFSQIHHNIYPRLPLFDAFWLHAVAIEIDGACYALTAPSGYGKSTQAALWTGRWPGRARIINGDNPIIRRRNGVYYAYGTPFCGKEGYNINTHSPLRGVCYLRRGEKNSIERLDPCVAYGRLLHDSAEFIGPDDMRALATVLADFAAAVPVYRLICNQEPEAAEVAYEGMKHGGN